MAALTLEAVAERMLGAIAAACPRQEPRRT
jgi:hypothetical protein